MSNKNNETSDMDIVTAIGNFLKLIPIVSQLIPLLSKLGQWLKSKIKLICNPPQKKFKFHGNRVLFITQKELINNEVKLLSTTPEDIVVVRSQNPLELSYDFAKIVHQNIIKGIDYHYYFCYANIEDRVINDIGTLIQNLAVVKIFNDNPERQNAYDKQLMWNNLSDEDRLRKMGDTIWIDNQLNYNVIDNILPENLKNIKKEISIYLIPNMASETFCIHSIGDERSCYLRWNESNIFMKLPENAVALKLRACQYEIEQMGLYQTGIFYLKSNNNEFLSRLFNAVSNKFPPQIHDCLKQNIFGIES